MVRCGTAPPHWLALDLGTNRNVTGFIVRHAQAGGKCLTQSFFCSRPSISGPWSNEAAVCQLAGGQHDNSQVRCPKHGYVRLYIIDRITPARIPEFEVTRWLRWWRVSRAVRLRGKLPTVRSPINRLAADLLVDFGDAYTLQNRLTSIQMPAST